MTTAFGDYASTLASPALLRFRCSSRCHNGSTILAGTFKLMFLRAIFQASWIYCVGCLLPLCSTILDACRTYNRPGLPIRLIGLILELVHKGRAWVKLTGAYLDSKVGPPSYSDTSIVGAAFVARLLTVVFGAAIGHIPLKRAKSLTMRFY